MSQSISKTDSGAASPEAQFHPPSTGGHDSPTNIDFNNNHNHYDVLRSSHIPQNTDVNHPAESFAQGASHAVYNSSHNFHLSDLLSDSESLSLKPPPQGPKSPGDFGTGPFRSSFSAYNGVNGTHAPHPTSGNPPPSSFRMRQVNGPSASQSFASAAENFASHPLGIQHQLSQQSRPGSAMPPSFESRSMDFGGSPPLAGKMSQQFALDPFLQSHAVKAQLHESFHPLSHNNSTGQVPYLNGLHLQSQTPYGPHLHSSLGAGASSGARGLGSTMPLSAPAEPQSGGNQQEEISTIFVVGFPDDMQEREFQNMFTFSSGFEAATLKIPNKEYTAYGSAGPNDPYNIVTLNQGGVVVDNGRDGPTTSWPPLPLNDEHSHFQGGGGLAGQPPRKQIIGFAKFRSRQEALEARDMLQGRRVDIEKGAVLKAEMAKKNLHTKRGVGIGSTSSSGGSVSLGGNMSALAGLNGGVAGLGGLGGLGVTPDALAGLAAGLNLNSNVNMNALASLGGGDPLATRGAELNVLGAMGYSNLSGGGWREGRLGDSSEDERERDRDRDREKRREAIVGLGMSIGRGARERALAEEEERERLRRKESKVAQGEPARMLSGNSAVYDAFHPVSTSSRNLPGGLLSPSGGPSGEGVGPHAVIGNTFGGGVIAQTSSRDENGPREPVGPWDQPSPRERDSVGYAALSSLYGVRKGSVIPRPPSPRDHSPPKSNVPFASPFHDEDGMLPPHRSGPLRSTPSFAPAVDEPLQISRPAAPPSSSTSSTGGLDDVRPVPLTVSTSGQPSTGNTSPQLPSPASHAGSTSSGGGHATSTSSGPSNVGGVGPRNPLVDQNPPINTLYVGNLPTSPVGGGYPANYLEDSLRELFSRRPGYRKLCFRQKSNGPMCFVEFEDVHYATKALNELYGNSLGGLVKNGGIRLSYSKNPLGVRTPTNAGTGPSSQSTTHSATASPFSADIFQFRQGFDGDSGILNIRRESAATTSPPPPSAFGGYARSPPPPRFVSPPPPAGSFNMTPSSSPTNGTTLTRGPHSFGITLGGTGGATNFSPFGFPLSSPPSQSSVVPPSHSMIPDHPSSDALIHGHPQHFSHRALSPSSSTVEAAKAG